MSFLRASLGILGNEALLANSVRGTLRSEFIYFFSKTTRESVCANPEQGCNN
jgi:hypothetical protein